VQPGDIYRHAAFYLGDTGEIKTKYLLVLAAPINTDVVARLLTSRPHGRPETPPCYHGLPYGGYFLGVIGAPLVRKSWVDLRYLGDLDPIDARAEQTRGILTRISTLPREALRAVIECVAAAEDTTRRQEKHLRDTLAALRR
jgi:hypothetical protein